MIWKICIFGTIVLGILGVACGEVTRKTDTVAAAQDLGEGFDFLIQDEKGADRSQWVGGGDQLMAKQTLDLKEQNLRLIVREKNNANQLNAVFFSSRKFTEEGVEVGTGERWNARWDETKNYWWIPLNEKLIEQLGYTNSRETFVFRLELMTSNKRIFKEISFRFFLSPVVPKVKPVSPEALPSLEGVREQLKQSSYVGEAMRMFNDSPFPVDVHWDASTFQSENEESVAGYYFLLKVFQSTPYSAPEEKQGIYQARAKLAAKAVRVVRSPESFEKRVEEIHPIAANPTGSFRFNSGEILEVSVLWGVKEGEPEIKLPSPETYLHEWRTRVKLPPIPGFPEREDWALHRENRTNHWGFVGISVPALGQLVWSISEVGELSEKIRFDSPKVPNDRAIKLGQCPDSAYPFPNGNGRY